METKHVNGKGAEILARCPADIPVYAAELEVLTQLTGFHLTRFAWKIDNSFANWQMLE